MLTLEHLAGLLEAHRAAAKLSLKDFELAGHRFSAHPSLMGVINLSPDSWYRESVCLSAESAIRRGLVLHAQGAQLVDLGAESTLATAARVGEARQKGLLLPIVRELRAHHILVSVETYDFPVAQVCLEAGANVVNLTGSRPTDDFFRMVASHQAGVILCYVQGENVREVDDFDFAADPIDSMREYFARLVESAVRNGVDKIWLDPGLGFYYRNLQDSATRVRHQMNVFLNSFRLRTLGFPICHALPHAFEYFGEEVRCAEPFFAVLAALGQTSLFRTHEIARTRAVLETLQMF